MTGMTTLEWLETNASGFRDLTAQEREVIMHFSLLWSLFECEVLNGSASVQAIEQVVRRWDESGQLMAETFHGAFHYFQERYVQNGKVTERFSNLRLRGNDNPTLVQDGLLGTSATPREIACVVLIIVFRFRNNLFHGEKWTYELRGQSENFSHSNTVLMRSLEVHRSISVAS